MGDTKTCDRCGAETEGEEATKQHAESFHPTSGSAIAPEQSARPQEQATTQAKATRTRRRSSRKSTSSRKA